MHALVRKCKAKIVKYLKKEYRNKSEFDKCLEGCRQPWRRFFVATFLLLTEKKILLFGPNEKTYLRLIETVEQPLDDDISWHEYGVKPVHVLDAEKVNWLEKIREEQRKRALEEYKQYRETYR